MAAAASALRPAFGAQVPRPAPPLKFRIPGTGEMTLDRFKGKVIGLEFLITTCPGCQKCSQLMQRMWEEYGPQGFQPVGVATNPRDDQQAAPMLAEYVRRFGVKFPLGWAPNTVAHGFLQHPVMQTMYVPQLVFIDRSHTIRAQYGGQDPFFKDEEKNMRAQIESLLKARS